MSKRKQPSRSDTPSAPSASHAKGTSFAEAAGKLGNIEPLDRANVSSLPPPANPQSTALDPDAQDVGSTRSASRAKKSTPSEKIKATRSQMRSLRAGSIRPQETIDLHGFRLDRAHLRLCNSIAAAAGKGMRCVLVVHGRGHHSSDGRSVIKEALADWIAEPPLAGRVIGCCLAQARDGGAGASYLLLK